MQLVTGYTGTKHVSAQDDSIRNVMLGEFNGRGVFPVFDAFEATAVTANEVRVSSGYGVNQGRLFKIDRNDYDSCTIENGAAGYKRVDLIVARYLKDEQTGIESCELVVIKGTPSSEGYVDPTYTTGNLLTGALQDDMPMYRVKLNGVAIEAVEQMFEKYESLIGGVDKRIYALTEQQFDDKLGENQQRFEDWFASVQEYLEGDIAMELTNAVGSHNAALGAFNNNVKDSDGNVSGLGVLPINHGGTGATTVAGARNNLGLGNTSGALPIANGGTGATTVASARNNLGLGNTTGALPIANGGTGASTVAGARNNLGLGNTSGALPIANGGTGVATSSALQLLIGNLMYPVGSIYMSTNSTNPSSKFGGTWVAWGSGQVPVGVNTKDTDFATVEKTGGAKTVTLTKEQSGLPAHSHGFTQPTVNGGAVTNGITGGAVTNGITGGGHTHKTYAYNENNSTRRRIEPSLSSEWWMIAGSNESSHAHPYYETSSTTHTHNLPAHTHNLPAHTHTVSGGAVATNNGANASQAHNNLQPYITCYMWKRTA